MVLNNNTEKVFIRMNTLLYTLIGRYISLSLFAFGSIFCIGTRQSQFCILALTPLHADYAGSNNKCYN